MKNTWIIKGITVYGESSVIEKGYVLIQNGIITELGSIDMFRPSVEDDIPVIELPAHFHLIPGMIDMHIHGAAGADVMDGTQEALSKIAKALPREGTTSFLATTITQQDQQLECALQAVSDYMNKPHQGDRAEVLGVHLEGPFISEKRSGAQPKDFIQEPNLSLFQKWQNIAKKQIKMVTLAPEKKEALPLIRYLKEHGVIASIGHSDATYEEVVEGIEAGITQVTHLFNGMRGLHHREPGVVGAALLHPEVKVEMIVDGVHIGPQMVKLAYRNKGKEGIVLITDAMRAKCLGNGSYHFGGQEVTVEAGEARLKDGTLAGSILEMKNAILNMMHFTGCSLQDIITMTAENPAKQLEIFDRKGSIRAKKEADLVVLNDSYEVIMTFCRGYLAYSRWKGPS